MTLKRLRTTAWILSAVSVLAAWTLFGWPLPPIEHLRRASDIRVAVSAAIEDAGAAVLPRFRERRIAYIRETAARLEHGWDRLVVDGYTPVRRPGEPLLLTHVYHTIRQQIQSDCRNAEQLRQLLRDIEPSDLEYWEIWAQYVVLP